MPRESVREGLIILEIDRQRGFQAKGLARKTTVISLHCRTMPQPGAAVYELFGRRTVNVVPFPGSLSTSIDP